MSLYNHWPCLDTKSIWKCHAKTGEPDTTPVLQPDGMCSPRWQVKRRLDGLGRQTNMTHSCRSSTAATSPGEQWNPQCIRRVFHIRVNYGSTRWKPGHSKKFLFSFGHIFQEHGFPIVTSNKQAWKVPCGKIVDLALEDILWHIVRVFWWFLVWVSCPNMS